MLSDKVEARDMLVPKVLIRNILPIFTLIAPELMNENYIKLICLPLNSTHQTQTLDRAVFR